MDESPAELEDNVMVFIVKLSVKLFSKFQEHPILPDLWGERGKEGRKRGGDGGKMSSVGATLQAH